VCGVGIGGSAGDGLLLLLLLLLLNVFVDASGVSLRELNRGASDGGEALLELRVALELGGSVGVVRVPVKLRGRVRVRVGFRV